jgi:hypothetical protein
MYKKMEKDKPGWLMILVVVCWLMAGTFTYGHNAGYDEEEGPGVILYKNAKFKGSRTFIKAGRSIKNLNTKGWNDKISSIELVDNAWIRIYEHKNYRGASVDIKDDIFDLAEFSEEINGTWNDKTSSIKVFHGPGSGRYKRSYDDDEERVNCTFYKHANRRGSSFEGEPGNHRSITRRWNDEISSLWIRGGYQVTLYEHGKFQGKRLVLTGKGRKGSAYNLANYGFNDMVSSYKLVRTGRYYR